MKVPVWVWVVGSAAVVGGGVALYQYRHRNKVGIIPDKTTVPNQSTGSPSGGSSPAGAAAVVAKRAVAKIVPPKVMAGVAKAKAAVSSAKTAVKGAVAAKRGATSAAKKIRSIF